MSDIGIRTFLTFYRTPGDALWPFQDKDDGRGEHTWEGHRLPAVPGVGSTMYFATIAPDRKQLWEVTGVTWVYGENPHPAGEQDNWHLEVGLR